MMSSDAILEQAARDGSIDIDEWPRVLESVLQKLHDIVYNDFPIPTLPTPAPPPPPIDPEVVASTPPAHFAGADAHPRDELPDADGYEAPPGSQSSTKENDAPTDIAASRPPVPAFEVNHTTPQPVHPPDRTQPESESGMLPPDLLSLYQSSTHLLERDFAHSPPYTVQRLAELVLYPRKHYRFLPSYLRALDRVVSVSSPASDFPLPALNASVNGGFLTNGDASQVNGIQERESLGSDESLGGALLTPIPWLRNNNTALATGNPATGGRAEADGDMHTTTTTAIDGPNGAGSIETVSVTVNGVPSVSSAAHTSNPATSGTLTAGAQTPTGSPTLSEQSDASTNSSSISDGTASTEAQLRQQGGVTQGELLRQEQEAGIIPLSQSTPRRALISGGAVAVGRESASNVSDAPHLSLVPRDTASEIMAMDERPPEETPHARGPEEIGMEDMGPQHRSLEGGQGLDMEAAVGRAKSPLPPAVDEHVEISVEPALKAEAEAEEAKKDDAGAAAQDPADVQKETEKLEEEIEEKKKEEVKEERDAEGDVVLADADGRAVGE